MKHQVGVAKRTLEVTALDDEYWGDLTGQGGPASANQTETPVEIEPNPAVTEDMKSMPRKPAGFILLGKHYSADAWRAVLLGVCNALAQQHGGEFARAATSVKGRTRQHIAPSRDGMISPALIPNTKLWVETNQSARSVLRIIEQLLLALGRQREDFSIVYEQGAMFNVQPPPPPDQSVLHR